MPDYYPSVRYNRLGETIIVVSPEIDAALGPEWADTPAHWESDQTPAASPVVIEPSDARRLSSGRRRPGPKPVKPGTRRRRRKVTADVVLTEQLPEQFSQ